MTLDELYELAEEQEYIVDWRILAFADGFTMRLPKERYAIVIDPTKILTLAEHKTKLGHGLGHAETGSVYNQYSPFDVVQQHENRADKWNIVHQIPKDTLYDSMRNGHTQPWDLAEIFDVTEDMIKQAIVWYRYHTMDYKNYFPDN